MTLKASSMFFLALATTSSGWAMDMTLPQTPSTVEGAAPEATAAASGFKSGFGIGLAAGYGFSNSKMSANYTVAGVELGTSKANASKGEFVGDVILDYQKVGSGGWIFGLALELEAGSQGLEKNVPPAPGNPLNVTMKIQQTLGAAPLLIIGKKFTPKFSASLQGGPSFGFFKAFNTVKFPAKNIVNTFKKNGAIGFKVAAQVNYQLAPHWVAFLNVAYTSYSKVKWDLKDPIVLNAGVPMNQKNSATASYSVISPKVGISYRF